jgi:hypothetical protein
LIVRGFCFFWFEGLWLGGLWGGGGGGPPVVSDM